MSFSIAGAIKYGFSTSWSKLSRIFMLWLQAMLLLACTVPAFVGSVIALAYFVLPGFKINSFSGDTSFYDLSWSQLARKFVAFDFFHIDYTTPETAQALSWFSATLGAIAFIGMVILALYVYLHVYASLTRIALDWYEKKENNKSIFQETFNKNYLLLVLVSGLGSGLLVLPATLFRSFPYIAVSYLVVLFVLIFTLVVRLFLTWTALVDKQKTLAETFHDVWAMTENNFWKLFGLIFCLGIIQNIFKLLPGLIGLFVTFFIQFVIINSHVYVYKKMSK